MVYSVNGTAFVFPPTSGRWLDRGSSGEDGWGHPVYDAPREFEMKWDWLSPTGASQLQAFFDVIGSTGTAIVSLPKYANPAYVFYSYNGCIVHEPTWGAYFTEHYLDCSLLITNIHTT